MNRVRQPRVSFVLSEDSVDELRQALSRAGRAQSMRQARDELERIVGAFFRAKSHTASRTTAKQVAQQLAAIRSASNRLTARIDGLSASSRTLLTRQDPSTLKKALVGSVGAYLVGQHPFAVALERIDALRRDAASVSALLRPATVRRGRPANEDHRNLARAVAVVLKRHGVAVSASKGSRFPRVLAGVLSDIYATAPQTDSLMPLARYARDFVRGQSQTALDLILWNALAGRALTDAERWLMVERGFGSNRTLKAAWDVELRRRRMTLR